ncbi:MAG TPA: DoxX family protein [Candidatus Omnitrophota bacterium]|nr:DoxX family protein [Candidatus Omnitrophota bacterium]HPD85265.1 DoxX family protein [Candidatus Omnitrophota bacterium]HRZ04234.1 DoxX family protein [Candidatus Omnitrophota bacterium]
MSVKFSYKHREIGLLILRIGIGVMFIIHGWPKITGGQQAWQQLGMATGSVGIHFAPTFFGFMAAVAEFFGGICLILGLGFRIACGLLLINMFVASSMHLSKGDGLVVASHAVEAGILFLSLIFIGPGKYSLDEKMKWSS